MKKTEDALHLNCPFTYKELHLLTDQELDIINSKIELGELSFYSGIPVDFKIEKAYSTNQYLYVFPVIEGIVFLKKSTSIVAKNRTANPHHRISEDEIEHFKAKYGFGGDGLNISGSMGQHLDAKELRAFRTLLPKESNFAITANANSADDILNLIYEKKIGTHLHVDFRLSRLKHVKQALPECIQTLLVDIDHLPFDENTLDAIINFDAVDLLEKEGQLALYNQAKDILKPSGVLISAFHQVKELHAQKRLRADLNTKKALSMLAPWKKLKMPSMHFIEIPNKALSNSNKGSYGQTSLSRQFG